ncbi:Hypothetical predicted protein [Mytilus galloprovincialis]|uniref:Uncharacterized protein n=1 Tax=Mytilus galloprovincialis TaxID=29158 RepID=A0A8B6GI10_MYTGA|nr:Hypothetical predicted protein [Mytilus galloprovincialis]
MLVYLTCALLHALLIGDGTCLSGPNVCYWIARCDPVYGSCTYEEENKTLNGYRSQDNSSDTCSSTKLVNYCLTIVCILLVVVLSIFVKKHKRNLKEKQQSAIKDCEDIHDNARSNENNAIDDGINTYHVIDESQMDKSRDEPNSGNPYLNVLFSESDSVDERKTAIHAMTDT